ncbi:anthranilate phosphoribosyltransferase [Alkalicoccus urumqiensis]|uniref:Anthranilate phosphoribosyltransferase n=1 Tax=Alkalicoccus urumqiensis TaxID=1548213 RepID=A0A2P6MKK2_ALKUR|nr:anthranilate phosphoribosyltransferase [Alkalicoccus urumqiensis]PRO66817.1 anthranilate phosphoribosyltransferase [Alkalicoccus urumqiensis]
MTLTKVMSGEKLSIEEARQIVDKMMSGNMTNEQTAAVLSVLAYRGETPEEISGFAAGMTEKAASVHVPQPVLDTCGTGGDGTGTFNVSTASALLLSAGGVPVAKHGNRSVSSKSGSADVLEVLGIPVQHREKEAAKMLETHSLSFFFAPLYHEAMKYVGPVRKALGIRTIFNVLGPLTNPAGASRRVIGVYSVEMARKMAEAAKHLPIERALFVSGSDGMDEITIQGPSTIIELKDGKLHEYTMTPEDAGLSSMTDLSGAVSADAEESAAVIKSVFEQKGSDSARGLLLLNAGAGLYVMGRADSIREGVKQAEALLGTPVLQHLERLQQEEEIVT